MSVAAFTANEYDRAKIYLATTVAAMMGRKFEEEDWAKVYAAAKGFSSSAWSNFDIDVMHGNLGVEHKMYGQDGCDSLLACCGRSLMHPAGTRAFRFPNEIEDATEAARDVLRQYGRKIIERTAIVNLLNRYHHSLVSRADAVAELIAMGMGRPKALSLVPDERTPNGDADEAPDMRFGWLVWRRDLAEFLYFEQPMTIPNPDEFVGAWNERQTRGRRLPSRNLWIYREATGSKEYSITNAAGAKVQPYFTVPQPSDPNLYHFCVQGEAAPNGLIRIWLTAETAQSLRSVLGDLSPENVERFVLRNAATSDADKGAASAVFEPPAVEVLMPVECYQLLRADDSSVSDEHAFRMLLSKNSQATR